MEEVIIYRDDNTFIRSYYKNGKFFESSTGKFIGDYEILSVYPGVPENSTSLIKDYGCSDIKFLRKFRRKINWFEVCTYDIITSDLLSEFREEIVTWFAGDLGQVYNYQYLLTEKDIYPYSCDRKYSILRKVSDRLLYSCPDNILSFGYIENNRIDLKELYRIMGKARFLFYGEYFARSQDIWNSGLDEDIVNRLINKYTTTIRLNYYYRKHDYLKGEKTLFISANNRSIEYCDKSFTDEIGFRVNDLGTYRMFEMDSLKDKYYYKISVSKENFHGYNRVIGFNNIEKLDEFRIWRNV